MFCFVNDMVYIGVKLQVLIKYHTKEPHICGVEYFGVIDVISVNGQCFLCNVKLMEGVLLTFSSRQLSGQY